MKRISTKTVTSVRTIMVLGFDNYAYILLNEQDEDGYYHFAEFANTTDASQWLNGQNDVLPHAIICNYSLLKDNEFQFLQTLQNHPQHQHIPFILVSSDPFDMPISKALKMGIDDCYTEPVNWPDLKKRLDFLDQHKANFHNDTDKPTVRPSFRYKTPLIKRVFDIAVALIVILCLSPILLLIALCIKLDGGAIIYRSKRIGQGYREFDFFKFRSMHQNADQMVKQMKHLNLYDGSFVKFKNDPRITPIGRIIRKTSLDELPQLLNVLRGEMSIIGNRPLPLYEAEVITQDKWAGRFLAPAGITGLWQVAPGGKENLSTEERIGLDIEYAKKLSILLDFKILLKTIPAMIQKGE